METKRVLVTGGAGFMGSWLADELIRRGHRVINADNLLGWYERNVARECEFVRIDLRQKDEVARITKGVDVVFHLAGEP